MSEYQYYEFAAIDGPISDEGLRYARSCSSRANVSRVRWQNTYTFGDFHGRKEAKAATAKRQREAELRQQHLASVMRRADTIWSGLDPLMDQKIASACDQAAAQLQELRDAYAQAGEIVGFREKLTGFRLRYSNRPAMLRRIEKL
jgi:hypothetical protein